MLLIAYLIRAAGPGRVAHVLWQARPWIPLIVALELTQVAGDFLTLRVLLGRGISARTWARSSALAYALMILVPAGRAAGEVGRAAILSRAVGVNRAATASVKLQSAYVFAIGVLSAVECAIVTCRMGARSTLVLLLAANAVLMMAFSAGLVAVLWNARLAGWLDRLLRRMSYSAHGTASPPSAASGHAQRRLPWRAAGICLASRTAQVVQYGIILRAVGGTVTVSSAFVVHGVLLVAATVGDIFPNGLGLIDATYRTFAAEMGFGSAPARALSIAFLAHLAQLIVATCALVVVAIARATPARAPATTLAAGSQRQRALHP